MEQRQLPPQKISQLSDVGKPKVRGLFCIGVHVSLQEMANRSTELNVVTRCQGIPECEDQFDNG